MVRRKLGRNFYMRPALECVTDFLGKVLVHKTPQGRTAGIVYGVEAYPAFVDAVHHGLKKTSRSEIMWGEGGYAYVYLIYGMWYQFSAVVNKSEIPDVIFIRSVIPVEGVDLMKRRWDKEPVEQKLADTPGKLCKSFSINKSLYGIDLVGDELFFEDWGIDVPEEMIESYKRVGISVIHEGHDKQFRYNVDRKLLELMMDKRKISIK